MQPHTWDKNTHTHTQRCIVTKQQSEHAEVLTKCQSEDKNGRKTVRKRKMWRKSQKLETGALLQTKHTKNCFSCQFGDLKSVQNNEEKW